jgi:glucose/arabinose dehydrogenase
VSGGRLRRALGRFQRRAARANAVCCTAPALLLAWQATACGDDLRQKEIPSPGNSPFRKVILDSAPGEPIGLAVLPDGSVLHTTRTGSLVWHDLNADKHVAATLDVYTHDEEGLQGVAIDPDYEQNHWVYLYYSPALATPLDDPSTPDSNEGDAALSGDPAAWLEFSGALRLSRFRFEPPLLDLGSEQILLEVPVDRGICCHVGGQIDFDAEGNLYLSTGDDTNPFQSQGYTPIDERADSNPALDAQRSAANTNDLRGKLLRIRVQADGSIAIPEGNLFAPGTPKTRPEIYAMGLRNPFRFSVDREAGAVYLADYSPDAPEDSPSRGPAAAGKWMAIRQPGNYGWPYCLTPDRPYVDYDFATGASGSAFDCSHPVNQSPHNTGLVDLPPVSAPDLSYPFNTSAQWPELGAGGIGPMAGPAFHPNVDHPSAVEWPAEYAGAPLFYEWTRDFVSAFQLDAAGHVTGIDRLSAFNVDNPIDMEFGPDGALYVLEYGDGYFTANPEAALSRIEYVHIEDVGTADETQSSRLSQ